MTINCNDVVKVRLTQDGVRVLLNSEEAFLWDQINRADMSLEIQLHELMAIFGPHLHVGGKVMFEANTIELVSVCAESIRSLDDEEAEKP